MYVYTNICMHAQSTSIFKLKLCMKKNLCLIIQYYFVKLVIITNVLDMHVNVYISLRSTFIFRPKVKFDIKSNVKILVKKKIIKVVLYITYAWMNNGPIIKLKLTEEMQSPNLMKITISWCQWSETAVLPIHMDMHA